MSWKLVAILAGVAAGLALGGCILKGLNAGMGALIAVGLASAVLLICKYPPLLIAGLLYVGNYKTQGATEVSITDPTLLILMMLLAAIALEVLFSSCGIRPMRLAERLSGQQHGVLLYLVLLGIMGASYLHTSAAVGGWMRLSRFAVFETAAFFAPLILFKTKREFRLFLWACVLLALPLAMRTIIDVAHPSEKQLLGDVDMTKIGDGGLIGVTLIILLYYRFPGRYARLIKLASIPLLAFALVATEARSPVLSFVAVLVLCMTVFKVGSVVSRKVITAGVLVVLIAATLSYTWISQQPVIAIRGVHKEMELEGMMHGRFDVGGTTSLRLAFYRSALKAFAEHPLIGLGLNGWCVYYYGHDAFTHPHNFLLEAAAEEGIFGLIVMVALLWAALGGMRKAQEYGHHEFLFAIPVLLFLIVLNAVTGQIADRWLFFWIGSGFMISRMAAAERRSASVMPPVQSFRLTPAQRRLPAETYR